MELVTHIRNKETRGRKDKTHWKASTNSSNPRWTPSSSSSMSKVNDGLCDEKRVWNVWMGGLSIQLKHTERSSREWARACPKRYHSLFIGTAQSPTKSNPRKAFIAQPLSWPLPEWQRRGSGLDERRRSAAGSGSVTAAARQRLDSGGHWTQSAAATLLNNWELF